jgi:ATP-binding cassette subfamily F protein uup
VNLARAHLVSIGSFFNFSDRSFVRIQRPVTVYERTERPIKKPAAVRRDEKRYKPRKLTYKERKELETLPGRIEELEQEHKRIYGQMGDPAFYKDSGKNITNARARIDEIDKELKEAYARWEELEEIKEASGNI